MVNFIPLALPLIKLMCLGCDFSSWCIVFELKPCRDIQKIYLNLEELVEDDRCQHRRRGGAGCYSSYFSLVYLYLCREVCWRQRRIRSWRNMSSRRVVKKSSIEMVNMSRSKKGIWGSEMSRISRKVGVIWFSPQHCVWFPMEHCWLPEEEGEHQERW